MKGRSLPRVVIGVFAGSLLALAPLVAAAGAQTAAPQYQDSEPSNGSSIQTPPQTVRATFNEPLDDSSTMTIANACGERVDGSNPGVSLNEITVSLTEGHYSGKYTVSYTAVGVGGVTGTTTGSFSFNVVEGHPCDDGGHPPGKKGHHPPGKKGHHPPGKKGHHPPGNKKHGKHGDNEHENHEGGPGNHDGGHDDHSTMSGSSHTGHSTAPGGTHDQHPAAGDHSNGNGKHANMNHSNDGASGQLASGPLPSLPADGTAVLIALALCAALGVIGGVFLRNSTA